MTQEELLARGLPKWPQMLVTGEVITVERAKEIIRRTDSFFGWFGGGNDRAFTRKLKQALRIPLDRFDYEADPGVPKEGELDARMRAVDRWREIWGFIGTEYVHNSWLQCAYVYGPYGWCHPDGIIGYTDNVGKWPSCEAVLADWKTLAAEFPFLDIGVTLFDEEHGSEKRAPVVSFRIKDGAATVVDPAASNVHASHTPAEQRTEYNTKMAVYAIATRPAAERETAIPWHWVLEWADWYDRQSKNFPFNEKGDRNIIL